MRRIGTALFFSLLTISTSFAGNAGFYAGVGVGYGNLRFDTKYNLDTTSSTNSILLMDNHALIRDFVSQLRVGYANGYRYESYVPHWWKRFHWAVEAYTEPQSHNVTSENRINGATIDYHLKFNYGVIVKPGVQTSLNTTLQLHLGVVRADFNKIQTTLGDIGIDEGGNHGKSDTGFRLGLGLEGRLNRNIAVELAIMRTYYSNKSAERILAEPIEINDFLYTTEKISFKPRTDQIMLNISYYFVR